MKILVLNCGSSTIKYELFNNDKSIATGIKKNVKDYKKSIDKILKSMPKDIDIIGHRVVHGGDLTKPTLITKSTIKQIRKYNKFAPLHNPSNLKGIIECQRLMPKTKQYAVFDTAFHQTIPEYARIYAIPYKYYEKGIKRYGFHGISHKYVANEATKKLKKKKPNLITCHLGAGCSITAIKKGKVIDTSMGFTPLEGLVMMTRSGDIDPGIKISQKELNHKSGLYGLTGYSDFVELLKHKKQPKVRLALEVFLYRLKKYIGAYSYILGKVDAIVFTGGIGENNKKLLNNLTKYKTLFIKTDEEKMIAIEILKNK